jgi:flagellar hook protein FlgE
MSLVKSTTIKSAVYISGIALIFMINGCGNDSCNNIQPPIGEIVLTLSGDSDFFILSPADDSRNLKFTNTNSFHINKDGYLVNSTGLALQGFPVDDNGNVTSTSLSTTAPLKIPGSVGYPQATSTVSVNIVLSSGISSEILPSTLDSALKSNSANPSPLSYHNALSTTIYDSLGETHELTMYLIKMNLTNKTWQIRTTIDDNVALPISTEILDFNNDSGALETEDNDGDGIKTTNSGIISYQPFNLSNDAADLNVSIDFTPQNSTSTIESDNPFSVLLLNQDGFSYGTGASLSISENGLITIISTNSEHLLLGKIALAKFASPYNLQPEGDLVWSQTVDSGPAITGEAGTGNFGLIAPISHDL